MTTQTIEKQITVAELQEAMRQSYMDQNFEMVQIHELFGLTKPLRGLEEPVPIVVNRHTLAPEEVPGYVFNPNLLRRILLSQMSRDSVMLVGDKGTGKSSIVQQICSRMNRPLIAITAGPGVDESYLLGSKTIVDGGVKAYDGVLSYAYRHGLTCLIDEICTLRSGVLVGLNDILQGDPVVTLKHHGIDPALDPQNLLGTGNGMTIVRHPAFRLFATDNTGGKAQKDGRFGGSGKQNSAVRSRFTSLRVNFMSAEQEMAALKASVGGGVDDAYIISMVEFAWRMRVAFANEDATDNISFRELLRWAKKTQIYGCVHEAFQDAIYGQLEESDQMLSEDAFEETFGTPLQLDDSYSMTCDSQLDAIKAISAAATAAAA